MGEKKKEKEHFIKFQTVQHKSCLQMLCNLDGEEKYSPALISLIVSPPQLQVLFLFCPLGCIRESSLCISVHSLFSDTVHEGRS